MSGLHDEELKILRRLELGLEVLEGHVRGGVRVPKRLFERGLVWRRPSGALALTDGGERLLFRENCANFLRTPDKPTSNAVSQWLAREGFINTAVRGGKLVEVTQRGKIWLASLEAEEGGVAQAEGPKGDV